MPSLTRLGRLPLRVIQIVLLAALAPVAAPAAQPEDCPTWLPDLRCDRSGRYEGFERPIVAPYLFEDPFITTGVYPHFIWHEFPGRSALGGGHVSAVAVQLRVALTDRLAFIATKDGFIWERPDREEIPALGIFDSTILRDQQGWMNLAGGFKYALIDWPEKNFILSPALRIEVPTGSESVFEGGSEAVIMPSVSAAWGIEDLHLIAGLGGKVPLDGGEYGSQIFYHLYADYALLPRLQPFIQFSGISYVESGDGDRKVTTIRGFPDLTLDTVQAVLGTGPFEGADLHNLGSRGMDNEELLTLAVGTHVPLGRHLTLSVAYERPIGDRKDIFKQRVTTALRLEF